MRNAARRSIVLALLVGTAVACGSDDAATPGSTTPATTTTPAVPTTEPATTTTATTAPEPTTEPTTTEPTTTEPTTTEPTTTEPAATTTVATLPPTTTEATTIDVRIYLGRGERLAIVHRDVTTPAVLGGALDALLAGPTEAETADGLFTTIPTGTDLLGVNLNDGLATIDLTSDFETGGGTMMMQARIAQIVFTATQFDEVDAVQFWMNGEPIEFLGGEGIVLDEPQTRSDTPRELTNGIIFDLPAPGSTVTDPVRITGEGDVFEGDFPLVVRRGGVQIGDVEVVRAGAWGDWDDFSTTVTIDAEPGPIEIVALDDSGCSPPECPGPVEVVLPLTLSE